MADCLVPLLVVLTILDLAFVHATGAVDSLQLLPLWVLTLASPWLRRLQRHFLYRCAWNLGVLLVFAMIVQHATTTGLTYMLEDGLALAVLCQVHLLNNVGQRQRPDLVFFNSFLIAFVTSLFAPDFWWSVLFVLHAFALLPTLDLYALTRSRTPIDRAQRLALVRSSLPRTAVVVLATAAVFLLWPRDFARQGWFGALLMQEQFAAGLADRIQLDQERAMLLSNEVVAELTPTSGRAEDVPAHWRGTAFSIFDGTNWLPQDANQLGSRLATDLPWSRRRDGAWHRELLSIDTRHLRVRLHETSGRRVITPLAAKKIVMHNGAGLILDPRSYGVLGVMRLEDVATGPLSYSVELTSAAGNLLPSERTRSHLTELPEKALPKALEAVQKMVRRQLPAEADHQYIVRSFCAWLQQHRRYQLPGTPTFAPNLNEFLSGAGGGHCEDFATVLAMLLRAEGVACRLVGGYLAHEWDADRQSVIVRGKDAHAWVEWLAADGTWSTVDATPAADVRTELRPDSGWWGELRAGCERLWASVTGFDGESQSRSLRALVALPAKHPFLVVSLLATAGLLLYLRRARRTLPAIKNLHRAARAAGLVLRRGETPRELLARATSSPIDAARLAALQVATLAHEAARYQRSADIR